VLSITACAIIIIVVVVVVVVGAATRRHAPYYTTGGQLTDESVGHLQRNPDWSALIATLTWLENVNSAGGHCESRSPVHNEKRRWVDSQDGYNLKKTQKFYVRIAGVRAEIWTRYLPEYEVWIQAARPQAYSNDNDLCDDDDDDNNLIQRVFIVAQAWRHNCLL
jgi:hypothetical protein